MVPALSRTSRVRNEIRNVLLLTGQQCGIPSATELCEHHKDSNHFIK